MKNYTEYWKQTCIEFGKFVTAKEDWTASTEYMTELWNQFQEQQAEDINDILDEVAPNDKLKEAANKLEFDSTQDKINHMVLDALNSLREQVDSLNSLIKLTDTIVSTNSTALNNIEKDLYVDERFMLKADGLKQYDKPTRKDIK